MFESSSLWKGHYFAQLPPVRAAQGVKSHTDKSELTLKWRQEGKQLYIDVNGKCVCSACMYESVLIIVKWKILKIV